jgi:hypothetical protein
MNEHRELVETLAELRHYPEWRVGQLVANVAGWADQNIWDIEDDQLLTAAEEHLHSLAQRRAEARA